MRHADNANDHNLGSQEPKRPSLWPEANDTTNIVLMEQKPEIPEDPRPKFDLSDENRPPVKVKTDVSCDENLAPVDNPSAIQNMDLDIKPKRHKKHEDMWVQSMKRAKGEEQIGTIDDFLGGDDLLDNTQEHEKKVDRIPEDLPMNAERLLNFVKVKRKFDSDEVTPKRVKFSTDDNEKLGEPRLSMIANEEQPENAPETPSGGDLRRSRRSRAIKVKQEPLDIGSPIVKTKSRINSRTNTRRSQPVATGKLREVENNMDKGRVEKTFVAEMDKSTYDEFCEVILTPGSQKKLTGGKKKNEEIEVAEDYLAERILAKIREPKNDMDKAFLVEWIGWNSSATTLEALVNLRGCPHLLRIFVAYDKTCKILLSKYQTTVTPATKHTLFCVYEKQGVYLSDSEWKKEKERPDFEEIYGKGWRWIERTREWNKAERRTHPYAEFYYPLYLEAFHENAELPEKFEYLTQNRASLAAQKILNIVEITPPKDCNCSCLGPCKICDQHFINSYICRLDGNRLVDLQRGAEKALTLQAVYCRDGCKKRKEKKGKPCRLPRRLHSLLIAYRPDVEGYGVYAIDTIPGFTVLCEYTGDMLTKQEADELDPSYQMSVQGHDLVVDAAKKGNEGRFLNHSCEPNCGLVLIHEGTARAVPRLFIYTLRDIKQGDECTIDYHPGYSDPKNKNKPFPENTSECNCGAATCRKRV